MSELELRATASYSADRLQRLSDQANAHFVSTSGWLTASLFAINGAGLLASLNMADRLNTTVWPASMFGLGIVFAMLNAVVIQEILQRSIIATESIVKFWRLIEAGGGDADGPLYDSLKVAQVQSMRWGWVAPVMGWLSGGLFIAGAFVLASVASNWGGSFTKTCQRYQNEMLNVPGKSEASRETFTALGCRYHT